MYADKITRSMDLAITETNRRRSIQEKYNLKHGIVPKTIIKNVRDVLEITKKETGKSAKHKLTAAEKKELISKYTKTMRDAAKVLDFEQAAYYRDLIAELENK
jgi:excinuclease ABC subunit B